MTNQPFTKGLRFYQSANADAATIKDDFLIRLQEYDIIMDDIRRNPMKGSVQHYLLLGRQGSGKSTLLKRIQVEIDNDEQLKHSHIAINLAEEQANIYRLFDLLEEIIQEFEDREITIKRPEVNDDCNIYTRELFSAIHEAIVRSGKKIVLMLDNIDRIFENLGEDSGMIRELLLNFDDIKIIGGSTRMTEHFWKYDQPFYQFFRILELKPLSSEEIKTLLLHWSRKLDLTALAEFVEHRQGQLEAVRILTDGLPRTLQFFVNILISHTHETGFEYLNQIMDQVSAIYRERLNSLGPAHRKIVLQLAFLWEAAGAKEIATVTQMKNNLVSAQLKQLTDLEIVEKLGTKTKNNLYRLSERFFNLWLIFTQGNPREKRKAKCLTIFLENFYDADGLRSLASEHLRMIAEHKMPGNKAAIITKALAQSKFISYQTRDMLINSTLELDDIADDLKKQLPPTILSVQKEVKTLIEKQEWTEAIKLAETIEQDDSKYLLLGNIYSIHANNKLAEKSYLKAIEKGSVIAMRNLGFVYEKQDKYELAEKYFALAIEKGDKGAISILGTLFFNQGKFEQAEKYYLHAIEQGEIKMILNIGVLYDKQGKYYLAEKYYLLGLENGLFKAAYNLAIVYQKQKKYELAEKYYLVEVENGNIDAMINLGLMHEEQKKYELSEKYYLQAAKAGSVNAMFNLALFYNDQEKYELSEKYYLLASDKGDLEATFNLAILYEKQKKYALAEKSYLYLIKSKNTEAMINLGVMYEMQKKNELAEKYYLLAIEYGNISGLINMAILCEKQLNYDLAEKYYLQAIEKGNLDAMVNIGVLYEKQQKYSLAEKYYLLAIEKSDYRAMFNLAVLYYNQAINKTKAINLINELKPLNLDNKQLIPIWILISIWNGNINEAENELNELIRQQKYDYLNIVIEHLLIHYQTNLVISLFNNKEFGEKLKEQFIPIYYAASLLAGKDANMEIKIPPEIKDTVDQILENIKVNQAIFYWPRKDS